MAMAEPFKNLINQALVRDAAAQLQRVAPGFDARCLPARPARAWTRWR
jgi:hypothetical protein